jgi:tripartite-type tricarboxylate transporter receptor subunit TctC
MKKLLFLVGLAVLGGGASAQDFPSRPITFIVPFSPGGTTDPAARLVTQIVSESVKQPVIVENKAGGAGIPAAMFVKQAPPDGYTLMMGHVGTHAVNASLYSKLPYDPVKDFQPITLMNKSGLLLVVPPDSPAKSVQELVALAKTKAGGVTFASQGIGTAGHLLGEMLKTQSGGAFTHVPYKGAGPAAADLIAGRVDMFFDSLALSGRFVREGRARALAIASAARHPLFADVPTMAEAGYPGIQYETWFGILAPHGTPEPVVRKLNAEFTRALKSPAVVKYFTDQGLDPLSSTPEEFAQLISAEVVRLGKVVRDSGARAD